MYLTRHVYIGYVIKVAISREYVGKKDTKDAKLFTYELLCEEEKGSSYSEEIFVISIFHSF